MKSKLHKIIIAILITVFGFSLICPTATTHAADGICGTSAPLEVRKAAGCPETGNNNDAIKDVVTGILNAIIAVVGLVAVIFVIIGGINYTTSAGDSAKLEKAKKTILYACIGIAITVLSFAIVNFAVKNIIGRQSTSSESSDKDSEK